MYEWVHCHDEAAKHQLPKAAAFWIIWILSVEECSSLTQNWMQICCSTRSVILNAMATQYTCSLNGGYRPHWRVQWSHHGSCMCTPVYSWLPGYTDVVQTILVILTMAGLFPDRPCILGVSRKNHMNVWPQTWDFKETSSFRILSILMISCPCNEVANVS